jgi:hypothetical protein
MTRRIAQLPIRIRVLKNLGDIDKTCGQVNQVLSQVFFLTKISSVFSNFLALNRIIYERILKLVKPFEM